MVDANFLRDTSKLEKSPEVEFLFYQILIKPARDFPQAEVAKLDSNQV